MDLALAIEAIVPAAQYGGVLNNNTKDEFDNLRWDDPRPKPLWDDLFEVTPIIPIADALMAKYAALPDEVRGAFSHIMGGVKASLEMPEPDTKAAYWAIKLAAVPDELEAVKQQLVDLLERV